MLLEPALASSNDELAFEAARALAKTGGPADAEALRRAAASERVGTVKNALRGIELRGDPSLCEVAQVHREADEPLGPYARRAMEKLGC